MDKIEFASGPDDANPPTCRPLTFLGEFASVSTEAAYRLKNLPSDHKQATILLLVSQLLMIPLVVNDYMLHGGTSVFWQLLLLRAVMIGFSAWIWNRLRTADPQSWDRALIAWSVAFGCFAVCVLFTRPPEFFGPIVINAVLVLASYLLLPLTLRLQFILAGIISAGQFIFSIVLYPTIDAPLRVAFSIAFIAANLTGFFASRLLNIWKREQFRLNQRISESETHYRTLVDASGSLVWTMRPDGTVDFANKPWLDLAGHDGTRVQPGDWQRVIHPDDLASFPAHNLLTTKHTEKIESIIRVLRSDGEYRWVLSRIVPFLGESGEIEKWIGTTTDIHEYWSNKIKLRESNALLEEALSRVRQLEGILPICSFCKKIRDDEDDWHQFEHYISERSDTRFSHGICPDCGVEHYGEMGQRLFGNAAGES